MEVKAKLDQSSIVMKTIPEQCNILTPTDRGESGSEVSETKSVVSTNILYMSVLLLCVLLLLFF